jgi:hypothetical protein
MADTKTRQRVAKLRENRRARGECETNVWIPKEIRAAIDAKVRAGAFPNRRLAIAEALREVFLTN